jgi:hypothetical protein
LTPVDLGVDISARALVAKKNPVLDPPIVRVVAFGIPLWWRDASLEPVDRDRGVASQLLQLVSRQPKAKPPGLGFRMPGQCNGGSPSMLFA